MGGENQDVHAHLGWIEAEPNQIAQRTADPVIERAFAHDQVEAGFDLAVAEWQPAAVAQAVATNDDVSSHAPSASASPMICRMPNACS